MSNTKKRVSIVGYGNFGKVLYRLIKNDFKVTIYDVKSYVLDEVKGNVSKTNNLEDVYKSDVIFYCVPINQLEEVIKSHTKFIKKGHFLIDVLSVKSYSKKVFKPLQQRVGVKVLLTHPMFGPQSSVNGFKNLPIVIDKSLCTNSQFEEFKKFFQSKGLIVIEMTSNQHDRMAARTHVVAQYIGRILEEYGFESSKIDTAGAKRLGMLLDTAVKDKWELFENLQNYNKYGAKSRADFLEAAEKVHSRLLQVQINDSNLTFGIQGGIGSFNEEAIKHYIMNNDINRYQIEYLYTTEKVLKNLEVGDIDYGLFAIHNSVGGVVEESIKAISRYKFNIVSEFGISIRHFLMKSKKAAVEDIKEVMAHPQVLKQCKGTLRKKHKKLKQKVGSGDLIDTANAAKALVNGEISSNIAILGPKGLASLYDLDIIAENLQDDKNNVTFFLLVSK